MSAWADIFAGPLALPGIDAQITNELTAKLTSLIVDAAKMDLSMNDFRFFAVFLLINVTNSHYAVQVKP